jgi:hypothetical protein
MNNEILTETIYGIVGDNYYPNKSLQQLSEQFKGEELVFLDFGSGEWTPGRKSVRTFYSKKYNEDRNHRIMGFNSQDDKYISIYFDCAKPDEIIISKGSLDKNPELSKFSVDEILTFLGLSITWIIIPDSLLVDCLGVINVSKPKKAKKVTEKSVSARKQADQLLKTKKVMEKQIVSANDMLNTPARELALLMKAQYTTMLQSIDKFLEELNK